MMLFRCSVFRCSVVPVFLVLLIAFFACLFSNCLAKYPVTLRLPLETECFTAHVTCYSAKPNSVIFHVLMCFRVRFSVSKLTIFYERPNLFIFILFVTRTYYYGLGNIETYTEAHQNMTVAPKIA